MEDSDDLSIDEDDAQDESDITGRDASARLFEREKKKEKAKGGDIKIERNKIFYNEVDKII